MRKAAHEKRLNVAEGGGGTKGQWTLHKTRSFVFMLVQVKKTWENAIAVYSASSFKSRRGTQTQQILAVLHILLLNRQAQIDDASGPEEKLQKTAKRFPGGITFEHV